VHQRVERRSLGMSAGRANSPSPVPGRRCFTDADASPAQRAGDRRCAEPGADRIVRIPIVRTCGTAEICADLRGRGGGRRGQCLWGIGRRNTLFLTHVVADPVDAKFPGRAGQSDRPSGYWYGRRARSGTPNTTCRSLIGASPEVPSLRQPSCVRDQADHRRTAASRIASDPVGKNAIMDCRPRVRGRGSDGRGRPPTGSPRRAAPGWR
jgi:hypothetical protein